jgi:hypothetical protein
MSTELDNILQQLNKTITENYAIDVWFPSLRKFSIPFAKFKPLNISQQRSLIKTSLYRDLFNIEFTKAIYPILKENNINPSINVDYLTVVDKLFIILYLRSNINDKIVYSNKNYTFTTSATELISKLKEKCLSSPSSFEIQTFEEKDIKLIVTMPTILSEFNCESERNLSEDINVNKHVQTIISETVINEITKSCRQVHIGSQDIPLDSYTFIEKKKLLELIPVFVLEKSLNFILDYRQIIEDTLTLTSFNDKEEIITDNLQINGAFFASI